MQVCQRFLKHAIPWFIGVGLRYWTLCNSTHGPSGVLGYWQVTGVSLWFIPLPIRYFNRGITGAGRQKSRLRDTGAFQRGSLLMDKQLLLMAVRLTQCRLVPHIANTVLCWQHFPDLSLLTGWQRCTWVYVHIWTYIGFSSSKWPETFSDFWKHIIRNCYWKSVFFSITQCLYRSH